MSESYSNARTIASGVLPFFDDTKTILLGQEWRENFNAHFWMEFGGKRDHDETLAYTAWRETIEETAGTLSITLQQVIDAERNGHYIDNYNEQSGVFYRMYCVKLSEKPDPELFKVNSVGKESVEKINWQYFNTKDVIYNIDGVLPGKDNILYSTMRVRLDKLRMAPFLQNFLN